ncbi:MAG TPA: hypothetical protein VGM32_01770 [Rhodopila sp.]|jgi:hypothetical protein
MLLDQVTETQIQAGRILGGAAMVALLAAPMFRRRAQTIRLIAAGVYIAALAGFVLYFLL